MTKVKFSKFSNWQSIEILPRITFYKKDNEDGMAVDDTPIYKKNSEMWISWLIWHIIISFY